MKIVDLIGDEAGSDYSSDSDQEGQEFPQLASIAERNVQPFIDDINQRLREDRPIDLTQYPPLYIIHYRGVHYFQSFFPEAESRRARRHRIRQGQFRESIYSPALYELAGLPLGAPIDSLGKKQRIRQAQATLRGGFASLVSSPADQKAWWGKKKSHEKLLHQHYQRFVNTYSDFCGESKEKKYACYQVMPSSKNPYVSTADEARHAVLYALGLKSELHGSLRPRYTPSGRPKHPKIGDVQIIAHRLQDIARQQPIPLSVLVAEGKIDIGRELYERETTFKGWITAKHVIHTQQMRFPSFNIEFREAYHPHKYGIESKRSFNANKKPICGRGREGQAQTIKTLLETLAVHYTKQLDHRAQQWVASQGGGYIVYLGLDGRLHSNLFTTMDVRSARESKALAGAESWFEYNLAKFQQLPAEDATDSDEEFPLLRRQPQQAIEANQRGINDFRQSRYSEAITAFSEAIQYDYTSAVDYSNRALAKYALNREDLTAAEDYRTALRLNPEIGNDYDSTQRSYFSDMTLKCALWYGGRGNQKYEGGDHKGAIFNYTWAILYHKNATCYANRALSKYLLNKEDITAGRDCRIALRLNPQIGNDYDSMQRSYFSDMTLKRAVWYNDRGNLKYQEGDHKGAIFNYTWAILYHKNAIYYANRALSKYALNPEDLTAVEDYFTAWRLNQNINSQYYLAQQHLFSMMTAKWYNHQGNIKFQEGNQLEAIANYTQAITYDDKNACYYINRAISKYLLNKNDLTAREDYSKAIQLLPTITSYYTDPCFGVIFQALKNIPSQRPSHLSSVPGTVLFPAKGEVSAVSAQPDVSITPPYSVMGKPPFG